MKIKVIWIVSGQEWIEISTDKMSFNLGHVRILELVLLYECIVKKEEEVDCQGSGMKSNVTKRIGPSYYTRNVLLMLLFCNALKIIKKVLSMVRN